MACIKCGLEVKGTLCGYCRGSMGTCKSCGQLTPNRDAIICATCMSENWGICKRCGDTVRRKVGGSLEDATLRMAGGPRYPYVLCETCYAKNSPLREMDVETPDVVNLVNREVA